MIEITTKTEMKQMFRAYKKYQYICSKHMLTTITQYYKHPSQAKQSAWEYCKELCNKYNGKYLTVISGNSQLFTAGFMFTKNNKDYFCYISKSYDWCCEVNKLIEYGGKHENI